MVIRQVAINAVLFASILTSCGKALIKNPSDNNETEDTETPGGGGGEPLPPLGLLSWDAIPVTVVMDERWTLSQRAAIFSAMDSWSEAAGCELFTFDSAPQVFYGRDASLRDLKNAFMIDNWVNVKQTEKTIAVTHWRQQSNRIIESDVFFNSRDFQFIDALALTTTVDLESVMIHELGHFLGIDHSDEAIYPNSVMVPSLHTGTGNAKRTLAQFDQNSIKSRYEELCKPGTNEEEKAPAE